MNTSHRNKKLAIIALILSLLLHISLVLYFTVYKTDTIDNIGTPPPMDMNQEDVQQKKQQDQSWAETKARAGNFGAPIFFTDELDEPHTSESEPRALEDTLQPSLRQGFGGQAGCLLVSLSNHQGERESEFDDLNIEEAQEAAMPQQEITQHDIPSQIPQRIKKPRRKKKSPQSNTQSSPKKLPSLAQLSQGFLHHMKDEGTHAIHMLGKKGALPTDEQMKYERYLQKLNWCLQNSITINNDRFPPSRTETTTQVFLALNHDGTIKQLNIVKSSGNRLIDQFVLFFFRDAGSSFPPVPAYLPHNPFSITYNVLLNNIDNNGISIYRH